MVRIDNTMLRKEEGGSGNRIKYGIEPYILKRRKASGKTYDELGRRIGADGQPVKIGRPRKPEAETTRGRKRLAAEARKAQAATKGATTPTPKRTSTRVKSDAKKKGMETEVPDITGTA
jgi:hypothetical protein